MQLKANLIFSERIHLPIFGFDHTYAQTVKEAIPLDVKYDKQLPFGLSFDVTTEGTTIHADIKEAGLITLVDIPIKVGENRVVSLNPFPGFHINGTLEVVGDSPAV